MPFYLQLHHAFYPYISIARIRLMNQITTLHSFNLDDSVSWTTNFLIGITTCNKQLSSLIQPILTPSNKTHSPLFHYSSFQFNANNQRQPAKFQCPQDSCCLNQTTHLNPQTHSHDLCLWKTTAALIKFQHHHYFVYHSLPSMLFFKASTFIIDIGTLFEANSFQS